MITVIKIAVIPEQELWRAVPSSGHILGVISISSLWETACKAWQHNTEEAIWSNEEVFIHAETPKMIFSTDLSGCSLWFTGKGYKTGQLEKSAPKGDMMWLKAALLLMQGVSEGFQRHLYWDFTVLSTTETQQSPIDGWTTNEMFKINLPLPTLSKWNL